jgi:3-hydroxy-D-aspartate aldolase
LIDEFRHSLFVLATVISTPSADRVVIDAGLKAHSVDSGLPTVHEMHDVHYRSASDEHGALRIADSNRRFSIGEKVQLVPGHCDPTVNLHDWYVGIRDGRVEALWPIAARGPGI